MAHQQPLRWASRWVAQYARRTWVQFVERQSGKPIETIKNGRPIEGRSQNKPFERAQDGWKKRLDEVIQRQKYHDNSLVARCQRLFSSPSLRMTGSVLGRGLPAYAFVGVVLANSSRHDEDVRGYDGLCKSIRDLMNDNTSKTESEDDLIPSEFGGTIDDYVVGRMIGLGCNAAVHEARLKSHAPCDEDGDGSEVLQQSEGDLDADAPNSFQVEEDRVISDDVSSSMDDVTESEELASFEIISDEESDDLCGAQLDIEHQEGFDLVIKVASNNDALSLVGSEILTEDNDGLEAIHDSEEGDDSIEVIAELEEDLDADALDSFLVEEDRVTRVSSSMDSLPESEEPASFEIISDEGKDDLSNASTSVTPNIDHRQDFDLAIKIAFNFDAASNSYQIMQSFEKEAIPAKTVALTDMLEMWENGHRAKMKWQNLPPHPNIVDMRTVFVGEFPLLAEALTAYPDVLPARLNPSGYGRNMTMFLVMKKYEMTLRDFVKSRQLSSELSCLLLLQLLEGIVHMSDHVIAHRDLKSDNILLDIKKSDDCPQLVVSDFGCCLALDSLRLPYPNGEICKGGNPALMAPEVATASPGVGVYLDYSKADVWTAGTLAYEIFGHPNPFYKSADGLTMNSQSYAEEDLPLLYNAPEHVQKIVRKLLMRDQNERPDAKTAANMMQIVMWGPKHWLESLPCKKDVVTWLVVMAAEVVFKRSTLDSIKLQMKQLFLSRLDFDDVIEALYILHAE